jgi:hypothetical protein
MRPDETQIHWIAGIEPHRLGLMARPRGGEDLPVAVEAWRLAGVGVVVSLLEPAEMRELLLQEQATLCAEHGIEFRSFPIPDHGTPANSSELSRFLDELHDRLLAGKAVAIHCRAGIGRTGLVAACLTYRLGVPVEDVFHVLSRCRGLAMPDTTAQVEWVDSTHCVAGPMACRAYEKRRISWKASFAEAACAVEFVSKCVRRSSALVTAIARDAASTLEPPYARRRVCRANSSSSCRAST